MKKIYLLLLFILTVSVSFAQMKSSHLTSKKLNSSEPNAVSKNDLILQKSTIQMTAIESDADVVMTSFRSIKEAIQARQNTPQAAPTVEYKCPEGTLINGYTRDYKSYQNALFLYTPAQVPIEFTPYSDKSSAVFSWVFPTTTGEESLAEKTDEYGILHLVNNLLPDGYVYNIPKVTAEAAGESSSFQLGQAVTYKYMFAGNVERDDPAEDGTSLGNIEEYPPLTLANLQANKPKGNLYAGFADGGGFSSKYVHPTYGACTGIIQILPKLVSPLYSESVSVLAYTEGGFAIPSGGELKIQFFYITEDGNFGGLIAESTTDKFEKTYGEQGAFVFTFEEEEDGFTIKKPLILGTNDPIVILLSGFDSTWDFSILFGSNSLYGSSYTLHGSELATFGFSNAPDLPVADLYIQFNGIFNCLSIFEDTPSMRFPESGGVGVTSTDGVYEYNDIDLFSSFDYLYGDVWIESKPDWVIDYEFDNEYFNDYHALMLFCKADALPAGVTGRSGEIVVASYGVSVRIPVIQGDNTGIIPTKVNLTSASCTGDEFILRYPVSASLVSVYNVAGQKISSYQLPASGKFTIPAGNYPKGIYLFNFTGSKEASAVKVIKM